MSADSRTKFLLIVAAATMLAGACIWAVADPVQAQSSADETSATVGSDSPTTAPNPLDSRPDRDGTENPARGIQASSPEDHSTSAAQARAVGELLEALTKAFGTSASKRIDGAIFRPAPTPPPLDPPTRPRPANPTVTKVLATYGPDVRRQFEPVCRREGIRWPPACVTLLAFKDENRMEVWAGNKASRLKKIAQFPILAASGTLGPKLRRGDMQVPEGLYRVIELNPESLFHLSFKIDYPNADDIRASKIARKDMGDEIYIHGDACSEGCLAMGFPVSEKLFCLMAWADAGARRVIISPVDFRRNLEFAAPAGDKYVAELYGKIRNELVKYPAKIDDSPTSSVPSAIAQRADLSSEPKPSTLR